MDNPLGDYLRRCRERLAAAEDDRDGRRPAAPVPRGAIARRARISASYYARLERGERRHPGPEVVEALAEALELDGRGRAALLRLAGHGPASSGPAAASRHAPVSVPALRRALAAFDRLPGMVCDAGFRLVEANPAWRGLHTGLAHPENWALQVLLDPSAPTRYDPWHHLAAGVVEQLVAAVAGGGGPSTLARVTLDLILPVGAGSGPGAKRLRGGGHLPTGRVGRVTVHHPALGALTFRHDRFSTPEAPDHHLHVLFPADRETAALASLLDLFETGDPRGGVVGGTSRLGR